MQVAAQRQEFTETGGGSPRDDNDDNNAEAGTNNNFLANIDTVVPHLMFEIDNEFDSNNIVAQKKAQVNAGEFLSDGSEPSKLNNSNASNKTQKGKYQSIQNKRTSSIDVLMEKRQEYVEFEKRQNEELHNIRMEIERENLERAKLEKQYASIHVLIEEEKFKRELYKTKVLLESNIEVADSD